MVTVPQAFGLSWQGTLRDFAGIVFSIRRSHASGRLSLRSKERLSIAHLYFRMGNLAHIVGNRGDMREILMELQEWNSGSLRFDRGTGTDIVTTGQEYERMLDEVLHHLQMRGIVVMPAMPDVVETKRVIESDLIATPEVKQLITLTEWRVLLEGTRRVSLAVAHLVGPQEALDALRDIIDDCASDFPAFTCLRVDPSGYLQVVDKSQLDRLPREDLLAGFAALIAICEYFCVPLIGEVNAHKLLMQTLREIAPALASLGVFRMDNPQLSKPRR